MRWVCSHWFLNFLIHHLILGTVGLAIFFVTDSRSKGAEAETTQENTAVIERLVRQLGNDKYVLREQAQEELTRIGAPSLDALTSALVSNDVEVVIRARYLLTAITVDWARDTDPVKLRGLLKDYGKKKETQRRAIIDKLRQTAGDAEIAALCRIVRYEKSVPLSKWAAIVILDLQGNEQTWANCRAQIDTQLGGSKRQAAGWLRESLRHHDDLTTAIDRWKLLAEEEQLLWQEASDQTNHEITQKLLFHLVQLLEMAGRENEVEPYLQQIVELQPANEESVRNLVKLLLDKEVPGVIETIGNKFPDLFESNPFLLYPLAHAKRLLGKQVEATNIVKLALEMNPRGAGEHLVVAKELLEKRGWFDWAENEYRTVIHIDKQPKEYTIYAIQKLSEMLHDQQQEHKATDVLLDFVVKMDGNKELITLVRRMGRNPKSIHSRMHFFRSAAYELEGKRDEQIKQLDFAIKQDPTDADVLIARYRLPERTEQQREATRKNIQKALDLFRNQIANSPDPANLYNQFAWLAGNTFSETDAKLATEAINYSHKSLEIKPNAAGYLDTLGRCYYAKGDYENAVKYQAEAARLEPHSGLIRRQLETFQEALAKVKKDRSS
jgi:tetratricopeptide (TPR) repeat protein